MDTNYETKHVFESGNRSEGNLDRPNRGAAVTLSNEPTIQEGDLTEVPFDQSVFDRNGGVDLPNNGITVGSDGLYTVQSHIGFKGIPNECFTRIVIRVNDIGDGIAKASSANDTDQFAQVHTGTHVVLTAGDTITVDVEYDAGGTGSASLNNDRDITCLSAVRLG